MTVYTVLMDFAFASILILVGQLLRAKVPLIQKFFIPSSMLAGFLGLFLGPQFLNVLHYSDSISSYTSVLMIPIFAAIGINGFKIDKQTMRNEGERVLGYGLYKAAQSALQWWLPCLLCVTVGTAIWPEINNVFGLQLASGFLGGHGTAAAVGTTLAEMGYENAGDIGLTLCNRRYFLPVFSAVSSTSSGPPPRAILSISRAFSTSPAT